jgi:hypothetical protein
LPARREFAGRVITQLRELESESDIDSAREPKSIEWNRPQPLLAARSARFRGQMCDQFIG